MPEFGEFLSFMEKLRLGVPQRTPRQLAVIVADIRRTHDLDTDVVQLVDVLENVILEVHGPLGLQEFQQELWKRR